MAGGAAGPRRQAVRHRRRDQRDPPLPDRAGAAGIEIRPFEERDLPAALELQALGYPAHLRDGEEAFVSRLRVAPGWCWVAETRGYLEGYLLSHPWASCNPPVPDVVLDAAEGPVWYVHDVSVGALVRGQGVARAMLDACFAANPGIRRSELVAVEFAGRFWERQGWRPLPDPSSALAAKVAEYGEHATYMVREFG